MKNSTSVDTTLHGRLGLETPCFLAELLPQLMDLVRTCRRLPLGEEHAIRRGSSEFLQASRELGDRSLSAAHSALRFLDPPAHRNTSAADLDNFNLIVDSIDSVLERVDSCLKDALAEPAAAAGPTTPAEQEPTVDASAGDSGSRGGNKYVEARRQVAKPQVRWRQFVDNARTEFVPRIITKHNQKSPLPPELVEAQLRAGLRQSAEQGGASSSSRPSQATVSRAGAEEANALESHLSAMGVGKHKESRLQLRHPYAEELDTIEFPDSVFELRKPEHYERLEDTPLVLVRNGQELREMIDEIKATCTGKEIAVDVEHHDFRSYHGFVCLVQVSTRRKDFILDPFDMFAEMHMLNEILSDASILKVMHGADRDVLWLQRDFSVFIVSMFDTGQATRVLRLQGGFGLANLVSYFCSVKLDKKYQTADWRERPLPEEMLHYARCDTHYLLYCFDCLRNVLLTHEGGAFNMAAAQAGDDFHATDDGIGSVRSVMDKSTALCRKMYSQSAFDGANAAMRLSERFGSKQRPPDSKQFRALQALAEWRDRLARSLDESWNFVSPDACLWRIALALPTTSSRLRSTCNPLPAMIQDRAQEVVDLVVKASEDSRLTPLLKPSAAPTTSARAISDDGSLAGNTSKAYVGSAASNPEAAPVPATRPPPTLQPKDWPTKALAAPSPLVWVTAGKQRGAGGAGDPHLALRSLFAEGDSSEDEGLPGSPLLRQGRVDEIHGALRFLPAAPAAATKAPSVSMPVASATHGAAEPEPPSPDPKPAAAAVEEYAAPIGRRKRKRRAGAAGDCLEKMANALAAEAYAQAAMAAALEEAPIAAALSKPPKKKKKRGAGKATGTATSIDPYL